MRSPKQSRAAGPGPAKSLVLAVVVTEWLEDLQLAASTLSINETACLDANAKSWNNAVARVNRLSTLWTLDELHDSFTCPIEDKDFLGRLDYYDQSFQSIYNDLVASLQISSNTTVQSLMQVIAERLTPEQCTTLQCLFSKLVEVFKYDLSGEVCQQRWPLFWDNQHLVINKIREVLSSDTANRTFLDAMVPKLDAPIHDLTLQADQFPLPTSTLASTLVQNLTEYFTENVTQAVQFLMNSSASDSPFSSATSKPTPEAPLLRGPPPQRRPGHIYDGVTFAPSPSFYMGVTVFVMAVGSLGLTMYCVRKSKRTRSRDPYRRVERSPVFSNIR